MENKVKRLGKKGFFELKAPLTSTKIDLFGSSVDEFEGKIVKLDLTRSLRGKSLELKLRVKVKRGKLEGDPISLELIGAYIRRMMRKGIDYVEDSFETECKDAKVIVKLFLITRNKVSRVIRNSLRQNAKKYIEAYFRNRDAMELFSEIMINKVQKEMSLKLKKIYPLALCEIRVFKVIGIKEKMQEESKKSEGEDKLANNIELIKEDNEEKENSRL